MEKVYFTSAATIRPFSEIHIIWVTKHSDNSDREEDERKDGRGIS
jgi:hypothetical protein